MKNCKMTRIKYHLIKNESEASACERIEDHHHRSRSLLCDQILKISLCLTVLSVVVIYKYPLSAPLRIGDWSMKTGNKFVTVDRSASKRNTEAAVVATSKASKPTTTITIKPITKAVTLSTTPNPKVPIVAKTAIITTTPTTTTATPYPLSGKYFVYTSQCHMPYWDPFNKEALQIFKPLQYINCATDHDLVNVIYDRSTRLYRLHLNEAGLLQYTKKTKNDTISCCYQQILRFGNGSEVDKKFQLLPCSNFHQDFIVPRHIDAMIVNCKATAVSAKHVQQFAFSFIQPHIEPKLNVTLPLTAKPVTPKLSVLMFGIDSLSRINFRRTMPLTYKHLSANQWFELEGYNKMGDNTFPNLMALLTGLNNTVAFDKCNPKSVGGLNKCKFLWDSFKEQGYHTAYAEDWPKFSTFNYLKKGFKTQPTDYYLRPMTLAIEKELHLEKLNNIAFCVGRKQNSEYIYDYALQLADVYVDEPIFGLFWANSFSHNNFAGPSRMDARMVKYFKTMASNGILERAVVIFLSDHGSRYGPLRKLSHGYLEERLPMFYISLPKWFKAQYPNFLKALHVNKNRLTSPYDVHMTVQHILELSVPGLKLPPTQSCFSCKSILYEVPENRTCQDAGISENWCSCMTYTEDAKPTKNAILATGLILNQLNNYLEKKKLSSICAYLTLKTIKRVSEKISSKYVISYRLQFEAEQELALFETLASLDTNKGKIAVDVESISRLSAYENTSSCVKDKQAKKYCICKLAQNKKK